MFQPVSIAFRFPERANGGGSIKENSMSGNKTICLWFEGGALEAATLYANTFPVSEVGAAPLTIGPRSERHHHFVPGHAAMVRRRRLDIAIPEVFIEGHVPVLAHQVDGLFA